MRTTLQEAPSPTLTLMIYSVIDSTASDASDPANHSKLILFIDNLLENTCRGKQMDAVVMQFSKAFDVVPHDSLLVNLDYYGIRGSTLDWIDLVLPARS